RGLHSIQKRNHFAQGDLLMSSMKILTGLGVVPLAGALIWAAGLSHTPAQSGSESSDKLAPSKKAEAPAKPLVAQVPRGPVRQDPNQPSGDFIEDVIVIPNCQLNVDEKTELATEREGVLITVGRAIREGEQVPLDHQDTYFFGGEPHNYRRLKEGDIVKVDEVLARVHDRGARKKTTIKKKKRAAAVADLAFSKKTRDEAKARYDTQVKLYNSKPISYKKLRAAKLAWNKSIYEVVRKQAAIETA